ncbi:TPA: hypothetical protein OUA31_001364 [Klebsiella aerogenes]|nr:hypothetical protein [Klebsiella aerogenes]HCT8632732.1 hypothetical protein [Klebsiella aerogenes]
MQLSHSTEWLFSGISNDGSIVSCHFAVYAKNFSASKIKNETAFQQTLVLSTVPVHFSQKTTPAQGNKISARLTKYKRKIFSYCAYEMRSDLILIAKSSLERE